MGAARLVKSDPSQMQMSSSGASAAPSQPTGGPHVAGPFSGGLPGGGVWRWIADRRSSPLRLRTAVGLTALAAVLFGLLGAYGVNRRISAVDVVRHSADQLLSLQNIRVAVVQADSLASQSYLVGGQEDPAKRAAYLKQIGDASAEIVRVSLQLDLGPAQTDALASAGTYLNTYTGLVEQARANNRQGFPVGAAYQRQANDIVTAHIVPLLRTVEQGQRAEVDGSLVKAHRAGAWLIVGGLIMLIVVVAGAVWLARRFRRIFNVPLVLAAMVVLAVVVIGGAVQVRAIDRADRAVAGPLTSADLVAQARAAGFDAASQEALALINRGNGGANEASWKQSSAIVAEALKLACNHDPDGCALSKLYAVYVA
ncbi:MAG: hypothetical protein ABIQ39_16220, partial [Ilumatobacteraceae bacterium]